MAKKKTKIGRPPKPESERYANKPRQIGRWTDQDWEVVQRAAEAANGGNVAGWAREVLLRAAKRVLREADL